MTQKRAIGIVAASFAAGLVATAMLNGPTTWPDSTQPFFGFADEAIPGLAGSGRRSPADQPTVAAAAAKALAPLEPLKPMPLTTDDLASLKRLAERATPGQISVTTFRGAAPARAAGGRTAGVQSAPPAMAAPDGGDSRPGLKHPMVAGAATASRPAFPPAAEPELRLARLADEQRQPASLEAVPDPSPATAERGRADRPPAETAEPTSAVDRSGTKPAAADDERHPREPSAWPRVTAAEKAPGADFSDTASPEPAAAQAPLGTPPAAVDPLTALSEPTATRGQVAAQTPVTSPESLRALVSRSRSEPETSAPATSGDRPATAAETTAAEPAAAAAGTAAEVRRSGSVSRSAATARGLQAAAAALEKTAAPVESLLTRTLGAGPTAADWPGNPASGENTDRPDQAGTTDAKQPTATEPVKASSATGTASRQPPGDPTPPPLLTTAGNPPTRREQGRPVRLEPRHARPRTLTAPSPPLQLERIGDGDPPALPAVSSPAAADAAWVDPEGEDWAAAVAIPAVRQTVAAGSPRERIVQRLAQTVAAGDRQPPGQQEQVDPPLGSPAPAPRETEPTPAATAEPAAAGPPGEPPRKRLLERLRKNQPLRDRLGLRDGRLDPSSQEPPRTAWPPPEELLRQLDELAAEASPRPAAYQGIRDWALQTTAAVNRVVEAGGPPQSAAEPAVAAVSEAVAAGMAVADALDDDDQASLVRRAAFAVKRRAATWQAAAALAADWQAAGGGPGESGEQLATLSELFTAIEAFEARSQAREAARVQRGVAAVAATATGGGGDLTRAVANHYAAPNLRISLREAFLTRLMPETTSRAEPVRETILGRSVRGRRVVEQTTSIRLTPDADEICFDLIVDGEISTYAVTDTGPISMASRGAGRFKVEKPVKLCRQGLVVGPAAASASNRSRLASVSTSFDSVPLMGSLLRTLARNQHAENLPAANREVAQKIIWQSCRETDAESERKFAELVGTVEDRFWNPLIRLGLNPEPFMRTTPEEAVLRLRLHGGTQLAAHTPRPREPDDSLFGLQVHQSTLNNACDRLGIAGERLTLEELFVRVQQRLGREPEVPEDLPEGVAVTFEATDPLRVEFVDGLIEVRVAIDALESGRRDWYDVIGRVSYKPVRVGNRVLLEREGPIRIGGPGHRGRIEFALRTIFGKIFPRERPLPVLPKKITEHPRLQDLTAVQAVSWDGWFALALAPGEPERLKTARSADAESPARR